MDADGFTIVTRRSKRSFRSGRVNQNNTHAIASGDRKVAQDQRESSIAWRRRHEKFKRQLQKSVLYVTIVKTLEDVPFDAVVCYGLGRLGIHRCDLQLALLSLLVDRLPLTVKLSYDPVHSDYDKDILKSVGIISLEASVLGADVEPNQRVLFFMPHCERWMYSQVLENRKSNILKTVIIGNSFKEYLQMDEKTKDSLNGALGSIHEAACPLTVNEESTLDPTIMFEAFNNMRVISFHPRIEKPK